MTVAENIGFPLAMKINSPDITHKSDVGGVRHLAGISSFQEDEVSPGIFGVIENYERVSDHVGWIEDTIGRQ